MKLQGASTPRPMTHDLLVRHARASSRPSATQVSVTELRDNTFYASITLSVERLGDRDRLAALRRARARRPRRRADLRRRGGDRGVRDRVRARGRGHRGGRREVQGVPRRGLARGLRRRATTAAWQAVARRPDRRAASGAQLEDPLDQLRRSRCPAASAACGRRLVSVRPGDRVDLEHPGVPSSSSIRSTRAKPLQPSSSQTRTASVARARSVASSPSSAGQYERRAADLVARLEVVEVLVARDRLDDRQRLAAEHARPRARGRRTWRSSSDPVVVAEGGDERRRARSLGVPRELDPQRASPARAGLTTSGKPSRSSIVRQRVGGAELPERGLAEGEEVRRRDARRRAAGAWPATLSMQSAQAADARAGVGDAERSRAAPARCRPRRRGPCSATKATSGSLVAQPLDQVVRRRRSPIDLVAEPLERVLDARRPSAATPAARASARP